MHPSWYRAVKAQRSAGEARWSSSRPLAVAQPGRLSRNGSTAASFSAIPQTSGRLPIADVEDLVLPLGAGPILGGRLRAAQHDNVVVVAQDVVDLHCRLGGLGLAAEVLQHLGLALIGSGPLAVATDVPDHVVGQVLIHPGGVAPLHGREAFGDGDVGMLVVGHGVLRRRPWPGRRGVYLGLLPTRIRWRQSGRGGGAPAHPTRRSFGERGCDEFQRPGRCSVDFGGTLCTRLEAQVSTAL